MAEKLTPLKAIRAFCLRCMGYDPEIPDDPKPEAAVRDCRAEQCELYPFRMGRDPNRKGRGGNPRLKRAQTMSILR